MKRGSKVKEVCGAVEDEGVCDFSWQSLKKKLSVTKSYPPFFLFTL